MKKILLFLLLVLFTKGANAKIWLVDNNSTNPLILHDVQIAITDSASAGDTIMIEGSTNSYGAITIIKPLVIYGEGYNDPLGENVTFVSVTIQSSNVHLSGFIAQTIYFDGANTPNDTLYHIAVERCSIGVNFIGQSTFGSIFAYMGDISFRNNIIFDAISFWGSLPGNPFVLQKIVFDTLLFENNIFSGTAFATTSSTIGTGTFIIRNNDFINGVAQGGWPQTTLFYYYYNNSSIQNAIVSNNIFYGSDPTHCDNCIYMNNIAFNSLNGHDSLSAPNNNLIGDPLFVNYTGGTFGFNNDLNLLPGSPCDTTGTGGTHIGITGGYYPFVVGEGPKIPIVDFVNISNTAVPQNSQFFLQFDARIRK